ncbi:hypothetical protein JNB63_00855 [Microbacterium trichothecenolyticum]|uniref:hypothetical protein n=1 Tax=Microbacterium trichothecenolyticum TaxID=69370 RepID=UPI001C6EC734|nr:hypothetical protein [Microbacterium trichothecenolyticum]MBW9118638.1 hypothetical protein [Microbacterium trichothecenolyticum]
MGIRSRVAVGVVAGVVLGVTGSAAAGAAPVRFPVDVVVHTEIGGGPNDFEGNIPGCETGTVLDVDPRATFTPWGGVFKGDKEFTCDSGSGGFTVQLIARFGEPGSTGTWTLVDAWGDFEGVKASGELTGTYTASGIDDRYTGSAR